MPWSGAVAQRMLRTLPRHRPRAAHRSTPREAASGCSPKTTGPGSTPGRGPNTSRKGPERPSRDICRGGSEARMPACHAGDGGASPLRGSNQHKLDSTRQMKPRWEGRRAHEREPLVPFRELRMDGREAYGGDLLNRRGRHRPPLVRIRLHPPSNRPESGPAVVGYR